MAASWGVTWDDGRVIESLRRLLGKPSPSAELLAAFEWTDEDTRQFQERFREAVAAGRTAIVMPQACRPDHHTQCGDIEIGDNQDRDCLSLYQEENGEAATVHICDWPALKAAVDQHQ